MMARRCLGWTTRHRIPRFLGMALWRPFTRWQWTDGLCGQCREGMQARIRAAKAAGKLAVPSAKREAP